MKLHLEINGKNYYLGEFHQRHCAKTFERLSELIEVTLKASKIDFHSHKLRMKNVQSILFMSDKLHIKLLCNNNDYEFKSINVSEKPLDEIVPKLIDKWIKQVTNNDK